MDQAYLKLFLIMIKEVLGCLLLISVETEGLCSDCAKHTYVPCLLP